MAKMRVHFMRNLLSTVPRAAQETVAAFVRTIFYQPDHQSALAHPKDVASMLRERFPEAADLLEDSATDVLAHMHFPKEHRRRLHSTNTVSSDCTWRSSAAPESSGSSPIELR
jgi:putative transposase